MRLFGFAGLIRSAYRQFPIFHAAPPEKRGIKKTYQLDLIDLIALNLLLDLMEFVLLKLMQLSEKEL